MEVLLYLVPLAIALGGLGLAAFLWSLKNGQYDDLDGAAWRAIADDEPPEISSTLAHPASAKHQQRDRNQGEGHQHRPSGRLRGDRASFDNRTFATAQRWPPTINSSCGIGQFIGSARRTSASAVNMR